jgi:predicted metal-dependent phosphoesterase TrpH
MKAMRGKLSPLLAELHAHTTWSDGDYSVRELVDLYGALGFDVLCVTDHTYRSDDPHVPSRGRREVDADAFPAYLREIEAEAGRARSRYSLLLLPGIELSYNAVDPRRSAHAVAVGLRELVSLEDGISAAIEHAAAAGAAVIGAHPDDGAEPASRPHPTLAFSCNPELAGRVHRFELFNRSQLYSWVARAGHASVAAGDFHRDEHLSGWKTLIPCQRSEAAVVDYLRSPRPVYLARFDVESTRAAA